MEFTPEAYAERLSELFRQSPSVQSVGFGAGAYKPGPDSMLRFDAALGHPSGAVPCVHVAGTNGKGTVCSMLASALSASGLRTGLYTSPHILDFRERIREIPGEVIPEKDVFDFLETFSGQIRGLSFFEITTGLAFWWFARKKLDVSVLEVGLGGRLDSTNIVRPRISIVTSIALDHCALLGGTRSEIAAEKAGIFKPGVPALVWGHDSETDPVFERKAFEVGCPLYFASDMRGVPQGDSSFELNLPTVLAALEILGIPADMDALRAYASVAGLRARWERISRRGCELILDMGHNPAAMERNFARLLGLGKRVNVVYGVMADKDYESIIRMMPPEFRYFLCAPATPRSLPVHTLDSEVERLRPELDAVACGSVREAVDAATADGTLTFVGGSTFVVSEVLQYLESI